MLLCLLMRMLPFFTVSGVCKAAEGVYLGAEAQTGKITATMLQKGCKITKRVLVLNKVAQSMEEGQDLQFLCSTLFSTHRPSRNAIRHTFFGHGFPYM